MITNNDANIQNWRVTKQNSLATARNTLAKRDNIIRVIMQNPSLSAEEVARKVYSGTIPDKSAVMFSQEGDETLDNRLLVRFNNFVEYVKQIQLEVSDERPQ